MLTCRDLTEIVTDYVEGRMGVWDRLRFQLHIGMCSSCREYVRQMQVTRAVVGHVPAQPIPDDVKEELIKRFRDWKDGGDVAPPALTPDESKR